MPKLDAQRLARLAQPLEENSPKVTVSKSIGFTVNLQGYESARIDSSISMEGAVANLDDIKAEVDYQLEEEIKKQIGDLINQVDPNKTLLGYRK